MRERLLALLRSKKAQRGQSLVELAISLTVMLLLLSGAVTFGMALFSYVSLRDAAQEGALWGSFNPNVDSTYVLPNTDAIVARVRAASTSPVDLTDTTNVTVTVSLTHTGYACEGLDGSGAPNAITVSVAYPYHIIMPFVGAITGDHINLRATVTDTILEPKCP
jgi:Flp pilus assembly protein TadG